MIYHLRLFISNPPPFSKWAEQPKNQPTSPYPSFPHSATLHLSLDSGAGGLRSRGEPHGDESGPMAAPQQAGRARPPGGAIAKVNFSNSQSYIPISAY
jgi:hypothetical protein